MPVDLATLGKRLADARANSGLTQEQVAEAVGLPRTAIVHIEGGERSISVSDLARLAELYGQAPNAFFDASFSLAPDPLIVLGRMEPSLMKDPLVVAAIRRHMEVCKEAASLEKDLGIPDHSGPPAYTYGDPSSYAEADEQGRLVAAQERKRLELGDLALPNITELMANQGIWIAKIGLPDEVSGLFLFDPKAGMLVMINKGHAEARQRFSLAHEYAHALLDRDRQATLTGPSTSNQLIERRANAFAASFLMPAAGVAEVLASVGKGVASRRQYITFDPTTKTAAEAERRSPPRSQEITYQDVVLVNLHFRVSYQATCYRLKDLRHINNAECDALLAKDQQRQQWTKILKVKNPELADKAEQEDPLPVQVVPLLVEAYRRELISRGFLMDMCRKMGVAGADVYDLATAD